MPLVLVHGWMDVAALRGEFPVLARLAYLNAGTDGPLAAAAGYRPGPSSSSGFHSVFSHCAGSLSFASATMRRLSAISGVS